MRQPWHRQTPGPAHLCHSFFSFRAVAPLIARRLFAIAGHPAATRTLTIPQWKTREYAAVAAESMSEC